LNRIGNQVFSIDLDEPANYAASSAPVHYPRIGTRRGSRGRIQRLDRPADGAQRRRGAGTGASIALLGAPSAAPA